MTHHTFNIDVYLESINVICDKDWPSIARRIAKEHGGSADTITEDAEAFAMLINKKDGIYIFFKPGAADRVIYHECIHIVAYMMFKCDLSFDLEHQEPIAYLAEHIIENVMKIKKGKK